LKVGIATVRVGWDKAIGLLSFENDRLIGSSAHLTRLVTRAHEESLKGS
jgi:hypothetical protein